MKSRKPADARRQTKHVRLAVDLAFMLTAVAHQRYQSTADLIDPLLREWAEQEFHKLTRAERLRAEAGIARFRSQGQ